MCVRVDACVCWCMRKCVLVCEKKRHTVYANVKPVHTVVRVVCGLSSETALQVMYISFIGRCTLTKRADHYRLIDVYGLMSTLTRTIHDDGALDL